MKNISQNAKIILEKFKNFLEIDSDKDLAEFLGVAQNTLSTWKARNTLDYNLIISKCELNRISLDELFFNLEISEKNLISDTENLNNSLNKTLNNSLNSLQVSTFLTNTDINFFNARDLQLLHNEGLTPKKVFISPEPAIAGSPGSYMSEGNEELAWFYMPFLPIAGHYGCFRVQGHSMEDYISEGSWVICRLLEEAHQVRGGKIHLVATKSDGVVIKRLHKGSKIDKEGILCYSDNPNYAPFVVQNEDVQAIWVVEMFLQREFPILSEKAIAVLEQYLENL